MTFDINKITKVWFSEEVLFIPDDINSHVPTYRLQKKGSPMDPYLPKYTMGCTELKYPDKNAFHIGTIVRYKNKLLTLEKSITDPKYDYGDFSWNPKTQIGKEMCNGLRVDISDLDEYFTHIQSQFTKACGPRKNNNSF